MTVLVTGATGFVGSAVVRRLLDRNAEVRALVRASSNRSNIAELPVDTVVGDLCDPESLERAVAGCDTLFHVAADYRLWAPRPEEIYRTNVEGTRNLLRAAKTAGVERVVYTSSVATLGFERDGSPANEETPVGLEDMTGHYKRSKFLAEQDVSRFAREEEMPIVIVNPSTPIGARDIRPTPTGRIIVEAATKRMPAFVDTGLNIVHVDDVAEGHLLALERGRPGERYVLGGSDMTLADILAVVADLAGHPPPRIRLPHGMIMPIAHLAELWAKFRRGSEPFVTVDGLKMARKRMFFTSAKAERDLGYKPRSPQAAIREAFDWFAEHGYLR